MATLLGRPRRRANAGRDGALTDVLERAGQAVVVVDCADGRIVEATSAAGRLLDREAAALAGTPLSDVLDPSERQPIGERVRLVAGGHDVPPRVDSTVLRADGSRVPVELWTAPLDADRHRQVAVVMQDASDRALRGRLLADDHAVTAAVLDVAAAAIVVTDRDGRFLLVNEAAADIAGRRVADMLERTAPEIGLVDAEQWAQLAAAMGELAHRPGGQRKRVITWTRPDGTSRLVEWRGTIVPAAGGRSMLIVACGIDVTDREDADARAADAIRALERRKDELQRANDELSEFASIAAHDLREPLRAMAGFAELLSADKGSTLSERAVGFLDRIGQAAQRMDALLDALSRYGRAGRAAETEPVDVAEALEAALESLVTAIAERGAAVTSTGPLPVVLADAAGVRQVLQNLIGNAIKFNDAEVPEVRVGAMREPDGAWRLTVADNGIGIPERERERVFDMFRRLHPRDRYPGTGAGLAIVQRVVERHGGRVWVEPAPDGGSVFNVVLPAEDGLP